MGRQDATQRRLLLQSGSQGEHPKAHLADFSGILHADGYAGFRNLYEATQPDKPAAIQEAACWAHVRRKFFDLTTSPGTHSIAQETLVRIGELYDIENAIRGAPPDRRKTIRHQGGQNWMPIRGEYWTPIDSRKNWLFAGSDEGGERAAAILSLIETAKLNDLEPEAYPRQVC